MRIAAEPHFEAVLRWRQGIWGDTLEHHVSRLRLSRCRGIMDAVLLSATHDLADCIRDTGDAKIDGRIPLLAIALSEFDNAQAPMPFAMALGRTNDGHVAIGGERRRYSAARFATLLRALDHRDWDRSLRSLRQAKISLAGAPFDVVGFSRDIYCLDDKVSLRWAHLFWQTKYVDQDVGLKSRLAFGREA